MGKTGSCSEGWAMLIKSLIQFSIDGQGCVPSLLFDLRPNYGGGSEDNVDLLPHAVALSAPNPAAGCCNPRLHWRLPNTHRQVWLSLLWSHCSFLLGPGAHKVLFVPSKSLFPQAYGSSVIKSHWPPKSNSLGALSPFARSPGWAICCGS